MTFTSVVLCLGLTAAGTAAPKPRPTVERRFAQKLESFYVNGVGGLHIRDDYFDTSALGAEAGYYPTESLGLELRFLGLHSRLNDAARQVRKETGLTPDAQAQRWMLTAGGRYSLGYGKALLFGRLLVHFDPQLAVHGGVTRADTRTLPTATVALSLLAHFKYGLQAKLDLAASVQMEDRTRGRVTTLGFVPMLAIGWSSGPRGTTP